MLILVLTVFTIFWPVLGAVILAFIDKEGDALEVVIKHQSFIFTILCYLWPAFRAAVLAFADKEGDASEVVIKHQSFIFTILCYLWPIVLIIKLKKKYYDS